MHEGSITICIAAAVKEIDRLNDLLRRFGELHEIPSRTLYAMNLALDEVVTNAVVHGYDAPDGEELTVRVQISDGELHAEVVDQGRAFNPLEVLPPDLHAPLQERKLGGLGVHLVRSLMDRLAYRRDGLKNVLTLTKRVR